MSVVKIEDYGSIVEAVLRENELYFTVQKKYPRSGWWEIYGYEVGTKKRKCQFALHASKNIPTHLELPGHKIIKLEYVRNIRCL